MAAIILTSDTRVWLNMRNEGSAPRTNGELVTRLINLIADLIEMQPHRTEEGNHG